jgi:hypothetical protein
MNIIIVIPAACLIAIFAFLGHVINKVDDP